MRPEVCDVKNPTHRRSAGAPLAWVPNSIRLAQTLLRPGCPARNCKVLRLAACHADDLAPRHGGYFNRSPRTRPGAKGLASSVVKKTITPPAHRALAYADNPRGLCHAALMIQFKQNLRAYYYLVRRLVPATDPPKVLPLPRRQHNPPHGSRSRSFLPGHVPEIAHKARNVDPLSKESYRNL